jgi:hypothetical protein
MRVLRPGDMRWVCCVLVIGLLLGACRSGDIVLEQPGPDHSEVLDGAEDGAAALEDPPTLEQLGACSPGRWDEIGLLGRARAPGDWVDVLVLQRLEGEPDQIGRVPFQVAGREFHPQVRDREGAVRLDPGDADLAAGELERGEQVWISWMQTPGREGHVFAVVAVRRSGQVGFIGECKHESATEPLEAYAAHLGMSPRETLEAMIRGQVEEDYYAWAESLMEHRHPGNWPALPPDQHVIDWGNPDWELAQYEVHTVEFVEFPAWLAETGRTLCGRSEAGWGTCTVSSVNGSIHTWAPPGGWIELWLGAPDDAAEAGTLGERYGPLLRLDADDLADKPEGQIWLRGHPEGATAVRQALEGREPDHPAFVVTDPPA